LRAAILSTVIKSILMVSTSSVNFSNAPNES
jgi:hypothetical protein